MDSGSAYDPGVHGAPWRSTPGSQAFTPLPTVLALARIRQEIYDLQWTFRNGEQSAAQVMMGLTLAIRHGPACPLELTATFAHAATNRSAMRSSTSRAGGMRGESSALSFWIQPKKFNGACARALAL